MKKILIVLAVVGMFGFQGCTNDDRDTISEVFELENVKFVNDINDSPDKGYYVYNKLTPTIFDSDVVLIYRLSDAIDSNTPVWQLIPRTLFLGDGGGVLDRELDYDFDFSKEDFTIYAGGNYNLATTPEYLNNQTFRIVIVPGSFSTSVNKNNLSEVMNALKINENQIQKINF